MYESAYNEKCDTVVITDGKVSIRLPFLELERIVDETRQRHIERNNKELRK